VRRGVLGAMNDERGRKGAVVWRWTWPACDGGAGWSCRPHVSTGCRAGPIFVLDVFVATLLSKILYIKQIYKLAIYYIDRIKFDEI
jgi:hypothetical protein